MAPGALQILIIVLLVMVLFGTGRIPTIMENLAKGVKSFKKGLQDVEEESSKSGDVKQEKAAEIDSSTNSKVDSKVDSKADSKAE